MLCVSSTCTHHGLCHVLPAGWHVDGKSEKDGSKGFRAHPLPPYASRRLPPSDGPPLHVLLLWRWGLLWRHQLRQLPHTGLADTRGWWLMLHQMGLHVYYKHGNKCDVTCRKWGVFKINMVTMLVFLKLRLFYHKHSNTLTEGKKQLDAQTERSCSCWKVTGLICNDCNIRSNEADRAVMVSMASSQVLIQAVIWCKMESYSCCICSCVKLSHSCHNLALRSRKLMMGWSRHPTDATLLNIERLDNLVGHKKVLSKTG